MARKVWVLSICLLFLMGCTSQKPEINTLCLRDAIGNYIIKWETSPQMQGLVQLYVSDSPDMSQSSAAGYANISDGVMTYITNDNISRKYFRLSFDNTYRQTVASRQVQMDSIQNLRDMGGYLSSHGKHTRWGKVFRSGEISRMSEWDAVRFANLNIKTVIDLRTADEAAESPLIANGVRVVHIPIQSGMGDIINLIREGRVRKGDGSLFMQDLYLRYVTDNKQSFAEALNVFLDENNYPILFNCTLGKDRTGLLAALLLAALDIPEEVILYDYMATNDYLDLRRYTNIASGMEDAQEALTVILSARETFLDLALNKIKKDYGSLNQYLGQEMQLNDKQRGKLKDILLF